MECCETIFYFVQEYHYNNLIFIPKMQGLDVEPWLEILHDIYPGESNVVNVDISGVKRVL